MPTMLSHKKTVAFAVFGLLLLSCGKPTDTPTPTPSPTPTPTPAADEITLVDESSSALNFETAGGNKIIDFTASADWTASIINTRADAWCTVSPASGKAGSGRITVSVSANDGNAERGATVQIKSGTVTKDILVSQKQKDALTVTGTKFEFDAAGGEISIVVSANITYQFEIAENCKDWIEHLSTKAMTSRTMIFQVGKNTGTEKREGSIIFSSGELKETVKVYQEGTEEEPSIVISKNEYNLSYEKQDISIEIRSNVNVYMEISPECEWMREISTKAMSTNTYLIELDENTSKEYRSAEVSFRNVDNDLEEKVLIVQAAAPEPDFDPSTVAAVDLGLSVNWASINIGATKVQDYGYYYAWGEIERKAKYDEQSYKFFKNGDNHQITKYCSNEEYGNVDNLTTLEKEDDVAYLLLGGDWRMPTEAEWRELFDNCAQEWTCEDGVAGCRLTSKKAGFTDKSIFIPANGNYVGSTLDGPGVFGYYWSATLRGSYSDSATGPMVEQNGCSCGGFSRIFGRGIRAVCSKGEDQEVKVESISLDKTELSLAVGESATLIATVKPDNASNKNIIWSSSDVSIASVSEGKVTAIKGGEATITVKSEDGDKTAYCIISVYNETTETSSLSYEAPFKLTLKGGEIKCGTALYGGIVVDHTFTETSDAGGKGVITFDRTIKEIDDALSGEQIEKITLPNSISVIGDNAFRGCCIKGPLEIPDNVTRIGSSAFQGNYFTGSLILPDSITSIGTAAFYNCEGLTGTLILPDSVTHIGNYAFEGCGFNGSLILPDSITSIGDGAFAACNRLTGSLKLPDSITSIGDSAFSLCGFTGSLILPDSITSIGEGAFYNCEGLTGSLKLPDGVTYM